AGLQFLTAGTHLSTSSGGMGAITVQPHVANTVGSFKVLPGSATGVGLVVQGIASQTADLLQIQNSVPNNIFQFTSLASMVNGIQFNPANAAGTPSILAIGTDAAVSLILGSKSTGSVSLLPGNLAGAGVTVSGVASAVDGITVTPAATANPATVAVSATGTDANINLNLVSKGTGIVQVNGAAITATNVQVFTANGTWTKPAGITYVYVIAVGAGGGGGGGSGSGGSASAGSGAGGGGGVLLARLFRASDLGEIGRAHV